MQEFLKQFEVYCKTPGIDSGKARSYAKAIEYLCDYLKIKTIDIQSISLIKSLENDIYDKNSVLYMNLLLFLTGRGQKSYLENGYIKASLKYLFAFFKYTNTQDNIWTKDETILALALYCKVPFRNINKTNPQIIELAKLIGRTPDDVSMKMMCFCQFDSNLVKSIIVQENSLEKDVWDEYNHNMEALSETVDKVPYMKDFIGSGDVADNLPSGDTKIAAVKTRINQKFFRSAVLSAYNRKCCVTGLDIPSLLIASHIKPWNVSDPQTERTNPCNGLSLNALHHEAFDAGIFTIDTDYKILVSKIAKERYSSEVFYDYFEKYEGKSITLPERFLPSKEMIEYHNSKLKNF